MRKHATLHAVLNYMLFCVCVAAFFRCLPAAAVSSPIPLTVLQAKSDMMKAVEINPMNGLVKTFIIVYLFHYVF